MRLITINVNPPQKPANIDINQLTGLNRVAENYRVYASRRFRRDISYADESEAVSFSDTLIR